MNTKRLTRDALLTAAALILHVVEAAIPAPTPIPGIKLGLANVVTVAALYLAGPWDAAAVLLIRIVLGSLFGGGVSAMIYALAGGCVSFTALLILRNIVTKKQLWAASAVSAMAHNLGQIAAAVLMTGTPAIAIYLPVLMLSGIVTGVLTGIAAGETVKRMKG